MATAPAASALTRLTVRAWNFSAAVEGAEVVEVAEVEVAEVEGAEGAWVEGASGVVIAA
jgi:hypothetical protein